MASLSPPLSEVSLGPKRGNSLLRPFFCLVIWVPWRARQVAAETPDRSLWLAASRPRGALYARHCGVRRFRRSTGPAHAAAPRRSSPL